MMVSDDDKNYMGYMPNHYEYTSWDFLSNNDRNLDKKMRRNDRLGQSNDEDYCSGGPCPSCRLAINKDTGRLKWCMGGNDIWRSRVRLMLLIPALLLPITIIFIAISRSTADERDSHHRTQILNKAPHDSNIGATFQDDHQIEVEDREFLEEAKTSFVPPDSSFSQPPRHKRDVADYDKWHPYQGNSTRDFIIWDVPSNDTAAKLELQGNLLSTFLTRVRKKKNSTDNRALGGSGGSRMMNRRTMEYRTRRERTHGKDYLQELPVNDDGKQGTESPGENVENLLVDYLDEEAEAYDNGEIDVDDYEDSAPMYSDTAGNSANQMPWRTADSGDKEDEQSQGESDEGEQGGRPSINDDMWLSMNDGSTDKSSDFHAFWKGEGDMKSIREAQAKVMIKYMDKTVDPCEDFYQYACGNWAKRNPIPKDKAGYDTFEMLRESLDSVLKELLDEPIHSGAGANTHDATVKAKHLFQSCMNYEILEQRMERPLIELMDELGGWPILRPNWNPENFDWLLLVAQLRLYNNDILISEWVGPDIKNSDQYVIQFDQTSLGLPTRDYFLQPSNMIYLEAYKSYLIKIATLLGAPLENATIEANDLIEFETKLAKITSSPDERRNVSELYQRMSIGELRTLVPQIDWHRYLTIVLARPANISEPVVVFALQYIQDLVNLLSKTPSRTISNYLLWRFVRHRVNNLDDRFQEAKQRFYYILFGREQAPSRWKNCVAQVNSNMGMAVGSMFVRKYFDENSKNDTLLMTQEIQQSFRELLNRTSWIDDETKQLAGEKVDDMLLRIGYPDFILQSHMLNERYKDVVIRPDKYFENTLNILQHLTRVEQDRLGSAVNKTLWNTAPAVVNAYYSRNKNQIMFPAGILQPPFYHRYFPRSLNYGGIGVVIGHEITHGFDDKGRLFDKNGNLHRWWKDEAIEGFHQRAQCLIDQYGHYTVTEVGMQIDGVNTQGENIADNGGIKQAFRAYQRWLNANGETNETLPGISATGKQLFFLNFAQVWCGSMRPEATRNKLKTAVHSPGKFRVIGTLSNSEDFAQVFNCSLGAPMNPVKKCSVW